MSDFFNRNAKIVQLMQNVNKLTWSEDWKFSPLEFYRMTNDYRHELLKNAKISLSKELFSYLSEKFIRTEEAVTEIHFKAEGYVLTAKELYLLLEEAYRIGLGEVPIHFLKP